MISSELSLDLELEIRPADIEDRSDMDRLILMTFGPGRYARTAERFREDPSRCPGPQLVAYRGNMLVGLVVTHWVCDDLGQKGLFLGPLAVRQVEQRKGTGAQLMNAVIQMQHGHWIILIGQMSFYSRLGFQQLPHSLELPTPTAPEKILYFSSQQHIPGKHIKPCQNM